MLGQLIAIQISGEARGMSLRLSLCKKGCYTHLYNIVIQVVIQYLLYTLRIIVYNCV